MDCVIIEPKGNAPAQFAVIWLHGLGADGNDFVPIVTELGLPPSTPVRFVFPHAPPLAVTINGGYVMRAWYDVRHPDLRQLEDLAGMERSRAAIEQLIDDQIAGGIDRGKVLLAGFSQGGVMALYCGLRQANPPIGGVVALSCYLPVPARMTEELSARTATAKVFLAHGRDDRIIPLEAGLDARDALRMLGVDVEWHEYPMAHSVSEQEVEDIGRFIRRGLLGLDG